MGKLKTKKTLLKRIKITKSGKIMKKRVNTGHLKSKWSAARRFRKVKEAQQENKGHTQKFKKMLGKLGKGVK